MGAIEGLECWRRTWPAMLLPISLGVLLALFMIQRFGTSAVGRSSGR